MTLGDLEAELIEINANSEKLQRGYNELVEYKLVLQKVYLILKPHIQLYNSHKYGKSENKFC